MRGLALIQTTFARRHADLDHRLLHAAQNPQLWFDSVCFAKVLVLEKKSFCCLRGVPLFGHTSHIFVWHHCTVVREQRGLVFGCSPMKLVMLGIGLG